MDQLISGKEVLNGGKGLLLVECDYNRWNMRKWGNAGEILTWKWWRCSVMVKDELSSHYKCGRRCWEILLLTLLLLLRNVQKFRTTSKWKRRWETHMRKANNLKWEQKALPNHLNTTEPRWSFAQKKESIAGKINWIGKIIYTSSNI